MPDGGNASVLMFRYLCVNILVAFVDYTAWKFKRERYLIKPYLELVSMLEAHFAITGEQVTNATQRLSGLCLEKEMEAEIELQKAIHESLGQLISISESMASLHEEVRPLLAKWAQTVRGTQRLSWRLRARFASLWVLDLFVPLALGAFAIWKTHAGVIAVAAKIVG